jgi:hypothetical protein
MNQLQSFKDFETLKLLNLETFFILPPTSHLSD